MTCFDDDDEAWINLISKYSNRYTPEFEKEALDILEYYKENQLPFPKINGFIIHSIAKIASFNLFKSLLDAKIDLHCLQEDMSTEGFSGSFIDVFASVVRYNPNDKIIDILIEKGSDNDILTICINAILVGRSKFFELINNKRVISHQDFSYSILGVLLNKDCKLSFEQKTTLLSPIIKKYQRHIFPLPAPNDNLWYAVIYMKIRLCRSTLHNNSSYSEIANLVKSKISDKFICWLVDSLVNNENKYISSIITIQRAYRSHLLSPDHPHT